MLNWNQVLFYVKSNLSLPSNYLEKSDDEIKTYILGTAHLEFSNFFPDWERTPVKVDDPNHRVAQSRNKYYFFDEEGLDIICIKEIYFNLDKETWTGHDLMGPLTFDSMRWWSLGVFKSKFFAKYSDMNYTFKFIEPNIVEILPGREIHHNNFVVEYERIQPKDLSKVPTGLNMIYMDLALAHMMIVIGNFRSHYSNTSTPFGDIPLDGQDIRQRGEDLRMRLFERMRDEALPPLFISIN